MIELMILGFLAESPLHGYELRRKMEGLHGYSRSMSDGTVYPAIKRLVNLGMLSEQVEEGNAGPRKKILSLTGLGRKRLESVLRGASGHFITDQSRFFVVLAFLSQLPSAEERNAVLKRRLDYLDQPKTSFFFENGKPLKAADLNDEYREGIFITARAARNAEIKWLKKKLS